MFYLLISSQSIDTYDPKVPPMVSIAISITNSKGVLVKEFLSSCVENKASFNMLILGDPWLDEFTYPCAKTLPPEDVVPVRLYSTDESAPIDNHDPPVIVAA